MNPTPYVEEPDIPEGLTITEYRRQRVTITLEAQDDAAVSLLRRLLVRRCFRNVNVRRDG